ncbi:TonB-dependent receptor [Congregibacter litoralis]|uniref:Outer membrane receptor protein, mostly Fe transport n=1 Tax=Congregibacter litoralis KT71 TaxID=314285 RepID=A4AAH3_9GAMM|nr:TonB-dependent receptor [Congregibacter litoralis]EAQ97050.1 Outer membrane receptor protein, mostly Fe transport [Congregibacter litoralis KT71]
MPALKSLKAIPAALAAAGFAASVSLPAMGQGAGMLEEVIVTAAKRQQTLQEIPIAVSVVTAEAIEQSQVLDVKDLQTLVPSLRVTQLQGSAQTNFIIRGFGNGANNPGIEPSVGVFIDGVYRSRVGSALNDLPKLERVEVLRGPQSTLFGKNASAGVINVVTAKPDLLGHSGEVGVTVGNYNQKIVKGYLTGPISDNLAFSVSGGMNQRDGYYDNLELDTKQNEINRWNMRGQLLWNPTDRMEVRFIADADSLDEVCCGVANLVNGPTGALVQALGGNLVPEEPFAYEGFYDFDPQNRIDTQGVSMQIDYDFDSFTLTSITAMRKLEQFDLGDVDYTSARLVTPDAANQRDLEIDTFTQELRLTSATDGPLQWMVGAFYFTEELESDGAFGYGDQFRAYADGLTGGGVSGVEAALGPILGIPAGTFFAEGAGFPSEVATLDDDTLSLFAQIDYDITDAMTLTLGANYTESRKEASVNIVSTDVFSSLPLGAFGLEALQPLQFLPPFLSFPNAVEDGETDDDDITYTVRLAYDLTQNINVYAGVSTGFKASSWNLSRDSRPFPEDIAALGAAGLLVPNLTSGTRYAGPEESTVYEIGLKAEFDTVSVNMAIFDQTIEGFQGNVFTGTGFVLANAGEQSTDGLELDVNWAPIDGLRLSFAATWLDPLYDDFQGATGPDGPIDLSGEQPSGIPELSTNTSATYNFNIGNAMSYARIEHVYEEEVQAVDNISADVASREINMFNASFGMTFSNGVELNFWGRNLNGDEYLLSAFPSVAQAGSISGYPNQPRTYGATLKYSFE